MSSEEETHDSKMRFQKWAGNAYEDCSNSMFQEGCKKGESGGNQQVACILYQIYGHPMDFVATVDPSKFDEDFSVLVTAVALETFRNTCIRDRIDYIDQPEQLAKLPNKEVTAFFLHLGLRERITSNSTYSLKWNFWKFFVWPKLDTLIYAFVVL